MDGFFRILEKTLSELICTRLYIRDQTNCCAFLASQLERKFELEALQKENNANRIHELGKLQKEQSRQGQQLLSLDQGLSGKIQSKQITMSWN